MLYLIENLKSSDPHPHPKAERKKLKIEQRITAQSELTIKEWFSEGTKHYVEGKEMTREIEREKWVVDLDEDGLEELVEAEDSIRLDWDSEYNKIKIVIKKGE